MNMLSRRSFIALLGALSAGWNRRSPLIRIRAITAGVELSGESDRGSLEAAADFLTLAKSRLTPSYEVQTTRIATQPLPRYVGSWMSAAGVDAVSKLDRFAADAGVVLNIGPVLMDDGDAPGFASWATDLVQSTGVTSFSSFIASAAGIHPRSIRAAAEAISAIAHATPNGEGNFRYCATAFCPPGTPFFPAAYHEGPRSFSIGLESPRLLQSALMSLAEPENAMRSQLNAALAPVEALAEAISRETGWRYVGIDTSPAPGLDASIGQVIETLSGDPFGSPSTLSACAAVTSALKGVSVKTCGYSGLMLPVLEDEVLAARAIEDRFGVSELLLYSSVCGTGLDVLPLAGDTPVALLADTIGDVAALAARYRKALSARLLPIPDKKPGDMVDFDNPYLTRCKVMAIV